VKTGYLIAIALSLALAHDSRAVNLLVYSNTDSGPGSLRQRIADNASLGGGNTIIFSNVVAGTITLTTGELLISNNVTILGPGATVLRVDGNASGRVFHVTNGVAAAISGLTITNGSVSGAGGGGILDEGATLAVSNCTIGGNSADFGGGMYIDSSTSTVVNCTISGNSPYYYGGGIYNYYSTLMVSNCTISGNAAGEGGGIYNWGYAGSVALTVIASALSSNSAAGGFGGGIYIQAEYGNATVTIVASTFSDNSADWGGAIYNYTCPPGSTTLKVIACTFSGNTAAQGGGLINDAYSCPDIVTRGGGGPATSSSGATVEIGNTILNAGASGGNITNLAGTVTSDGYNLSSDNGGGFLTATGDQINTDPKLGPLADNGGPTKTMALRVGSPAIDAGKSFGVTTDQRGYPRIYVNPNSILPAGGDGTDIGAYEASALCITAAQKTGNHLGLGFTTWLGTNYEVQSRSNLTAGSWASLPGSTPGNGGIANTTVSNAFNQSQQFYRIHPVP